MNPKNTKFTIHFFIFIIISLLFFDLGNVNALRQGTEGFYLLITQEMFEAKSFLTPLIYGAPHWSKPPLQFWLPQPLYWLSNGNYLQMGRLSILLFSLIAAFITSQWYEREFKRNWYESFAFLLIPIYFIKYSRIFMMEMTLTYLSTLGTLFYYSYLMREEKKDLFWASLFAGLSVLIKGPVSLAMIFPVAFLFTILRKRKIKPFLFFSVLSILIGSTWFVASYIKHGYAFIEYFFIRENLGKFTARNYPVSSVIQGLLVFTLPINLVIPFIFKGHQKFKNLKLNRDLLIYLSLNFCVYYFLWFLPKQKSHHYAVPAIPIFLLLITYTFFQLKPEIRRLGLRFLESIHSFFVILGIFLVALLFYFKHSLHFTESNQYISGCFFVTAVYFYTGRFKALKIRLLRLVLPLILFWQFILPMGILPVVPDSVLKLVQSHSNNQIFVDYRKPFFIEESLNREIKLIKNKDFKGPSISQGDLIYTSLSTFNHHLDSSHYKVLSKWRVWIRGSSAKEILYALKNQDLSSLQEYYILAERLD